MITMSDAAAYMLAAYFIGWGFSSLFYVFRRFAWNSVN